MNGGYWKRFCDSLGHLATLVALVGGWFLISWEVWPRVGRWHKEQLAEQLATQIETTSDTQAKLVVHQLSSLGVAAVKPLVEAATSERAAVSELARREVDLAFAACQVRLRDQVDDETAEVLIELTTALADHAEQFGPAGKQWAEQITLQVIDLANQFPVATSTSLLSQCNRVLESIPPSGPRMQTIAAAAAIPPPKEALPLPPPRLDLQTLAAPTEHVLATSDKRSRGLRPPGNSEVDQPSKVASNRTVAPPHESYAPEWDVALPKGSSPAHSGGTSLAVDVIRERSPRFSPNIVDVPTPQDTRRRLAELRSIPTERLLTRLPLSDRFVAGAIRTVLSERGIGNPELEMAARTKSPDLEERMRLIDDVSTLPAASARRLLRMLLDDDNGEVRLRALTVLATSNDPQLPELARRIAVKDEDPRVAEFASKLLRQ